MTPAAERAFTAIELLVVMVILALLGTLAGVAVVGTVAKASMDEVAARVVAYDAGARTYAARYGRAVELTFEDGVVRQTVKDREADVPERAVLQLPGRCDARAVDASADLTGVEISGDGRSRSYAVHLADRRGGERWIVIAGLTGQASVLPREEDAMALLAVEEGGAVEWVEESRR